MLNVLDDEPLSFLYTSRSSDKLLTRLDPNKYTYDIDFPELSNAFRDRNTFFTSQFNGPIRQFVDCGPDNNTFLDSDGFCTICDSNGNFIQNDTCLPCIDNCATCSSSSVCQVCDEQSDYFLSNSTCEKCALQGCLDCVSLS